MSNAAQRSGMDTESEVWQAISAFEQILEVMPDDRSSLETLSHAYEHVGDRVRALDYLLRLAAVVLAEGDVETAQHLRERLGEYSETGEQVREMIQQLGALEPSASEVAAAQQEQEDAAAAEKESASADSAKERVGGKSEPVVFRVTDELAFAWKLFESGEISQEDYSVVAQDLAELSIDPHLATVSVLHVLETRAFSGIERVMGYASRDTKTPLISVQAFDVPAEVAKLLSVEFMIRRGAVIFGQLLDELLVAVMNPYDMQLREDVERQAGRTCHFFLTVPGEFDALTALFKAEA